MAAALWRHIDSADPCCFLRPFRGLFPVESLLGDPPSGVPWRVLGGVLGSSFFGFGFWKVSVLHGDPKLKTQERRCQNMYLDVSCLLNICLVTCDTRVFQMGTIGIL